MNAKITPQHDCIILDACVVMNLYASGRIDEVLSSITESLAVAVYVMKYEALAIYKESKQSTPNAKEAIQLQPLIEKNLLSVADLETHAEKASFLSFSEHRLDDGEAATMAIACERNWAVATDDRLAIRIFNSQYEHLPIISTPEIMNHWHKHGQPESQVLCQALIDIESRANFLLGRHHPFYEWWQSCKNI
ncbi:MAG: hypothetical protein IAF02_14550 [Anaerolineae bacterium]|nr:hypothetical protein [Anaerolineae bacterium]